MRSRSPHARPYAVGAAVCLLTLGTVLPARGQDSASASPAVAPGSIVTVPIHVPVAASSRSAGGGGASASFALVAESGVTFFGPVVGSIGWRDGESPVLPVTFRVPGTAPAGEFLAGRVRFALASGRDSLVPIQRTVDAIRDFQLTVTPAEITAEPGHAVRLGFSLRSSGNALDSVRVAIAGGQGIDPESSETLVVLPAGSDREGEVRARVRRSARPGSELVVRVSAIGGASEESRSVRVVVRESSGAFPSLAVVPTTVFVGSTITTFGSDATTSQVAAIAGSGEVARDTRLSFSARIGDLAQGGTAFRDAFAVPRVRLELERPTWRATAGEVASRTSDLLGYVRSGRGVEAVWSPSRFFASTTAAGPQAPDGTLLDGHVAAFEAGWQLDHAHVSGLVSSSRRTDLLARPGSRTDAALARYEGRPAPGHLLGVDAGWMRIRDEQAGLDESGPAVNVRYSYRGDGGNLDLTARARPMSAADPFLPAPQFRLVGDMRLSSRVTALGAVYEDRAPTLDAERPMRTDGGYLGLRLASRPATAEITGRLRSRSGPRNGVRGTARGALWTKIGPLDLDASVEAGSETVDGLEGGVLEARTGVSIRGPRIWARVAARHSTDLQLGSVRSYNGYVSYRVGADHDLYASATFYEPSGAGGGTLDVEAGGTVRVAGDLRAYLGLERTSRAWNRSSRWRISAGLQQGLGLPLPLKRPSGVEGLVFEDGNANGRFDPGERTLDGVRLRLGLEEAITRSGGRFSFVQDVGNRITIEPASLGAAYLPPRDVLVERGDVVAIPVLRAARLRLSVFLDENGNGVWDSREPAIPGAIVTLRSDVSPGWKLRAGADGGIVLDAIRPGAYRVEVDRATLPWKAGPFAGLDLLLQGGESSSILLPVPVRDVPMAIFGEDD